MRELGQRSCDWLIVIQEITCPDCTSEDVKVQIKPFAEGLPELRRRRAAMITIELALTILRRASYFGSGASVLIEAVRLALRAVHSYSPIARCSNGSGRYVR